MSDRETLRCQATDLLQRLRGETSVPQELFELLDNMCRRLDRLELGSFSTEEETPTRPDRHPSTGGMAAVKEGVKRIDEIFREVKKD